MASVLFMFCYHYLLRVSADALVRAGNDNIHSSSVNDMPHHMQGGHKARAFLVFKELGPEE